VRTEVWMGYAFALVVLAGYLLVLKYLGGRP
jgi:hypothetical protein